MLHDLEKQDDVDEWDAPQPFGDYLTSSPSDRYLVAIGYNGQGVYVIDTRERRRVAERLFNENTSFYKRPVFAADESSLVTWASNVWSFAVPGFELRKGATVKDGRAMAAAVAREAPLAAFAVEGNELRLIGV